VGRAFVEFLSLKHLGLSPDERQKLDGENSFVWQCLGKLEGWPPPAEVNSEKGPTDAWKTVQGQLRALDAKIVGSANASSARASDVARAQAIANAIKDGWGSKEWSRFREEYINHQAAAQLQKEISELETKKQQLEAECANLVEKVRGLEAELSKLSLEDPKRPGLEGEREVAKKSWETKHQDLRNCTQDLDKKKEKLANHASRRPLESGNSKVNGLWERLTGQKLDELQKKLNSNQAAPAKANQ
jgi:chromosome segregation ATPase